MSFIVVGLPEMMNIVAPPPTPGPLGGGLSLKMIGKIRDLSLSQIPRRFWHTVAAWLWQDATFPRLPPSPSSGVIESIQPGITNVNESIFEKLGFHLFFVLKTDSRTSKRRFNPTIFHRQLRRCGFKLFLFYFNINLSDIVL